MKSLNPSQIASQFPSWSYRRWLTVLGCLVILALLWFMRAQRSSQDVASFVVLRGPLDITVMEGGSVRAVESQEVKCEVRVGYQGLKILKIVD